VWKKSAENVAKYLNKGSLVGVDGRIQTRNYEAADGTRRYITEVVADIVKFLDSKPKDDSTAQYDTKREISNSLQKEKSGDAFFASSNIEVDDDDLPFD
jgi:single-strand DNA-binding protein